MIESARLRIEKRKRFTRNLIAAMIIIESILGYAFYLIIRQIISVGV